MTHTHNYCSVHIQMVGASADEVEAMGKEN